MNAWKFFLFEEDNPKHKVISNTDVIIALCCTLPLLVGSVSWISFIAAFAWLSGIFLMPWITITVIAGLTMLIELETLHVIFDR